MKTAKIPMQKAVSGMRKAYKDFTEIVEFKAFDAMPDIGQLVLDNTLPITPRDTGALRNSGRFTVDRKPNKEAIVAISFGGRNYRVPPTRNAPKGYVDYAIIVHENLDNVAAFNQGEEQFLLKGGNKSLKQAQNVLRNKLREVLK